jgi:hypothetical protein
MYKGLGDHWVSSEPAFLALACVPFPFIFYIYGERIRAKCTYAREASNAARQLLQVSREDYVTYRCAKDKQRVSLWH